MKKKNTQSKPQNKPTEIKKSPEVKKEHKGKLYNISAKKHHLTVEPQEPILIDKKKNKYLHPKLFLLNLDNFLNDEPTLYKILDELRMVNPSLDTVKIHVSSNGGYVTECQQFINTLQDLERAFEKENRLNKISITITSHASSAGAFTFISLKNRYIYPNSRIMFHHSSGGASGKMSDMINRVKFSKKHLDKFLGIAQKYFTKKEWKRLNRGKDFWLDSEDMLKRGICTGIIIDGKIYNNKKGIKKLKKYYEKQNTYFKG